MMKIVKISDYNEFIKYKDAWKDLVSRSRVSNIFLTYEWIDACIRHFCRDKRLLILYVFNGERLMGIAPLMIGRRKYSRFPAKSASFIGTGVSDRMDFILDGRKEEVINLMLDYLINMKTGWDIIDLREIAEESGSMEIIEKWLQKKKVANILEPSKKSFSVEFNGNRNPLLQKFSRRFHSKSQSINNKQPNLKLEFERYIGKNGKKKTLFSKICMIDQKSWKGETKKSIFLKEDTRNFHREIFDRFSKNRWIDLSILSIDKEPIAYVYNYLYVQKLHCYNLSFDKRYSNISPGTMLLLWSLMDTVPRDISEFDFGRGEECWKARYAKNFRIHKRMKIFRDRFYPRSLYFLQSRIIPYMRKNKNKNKGLCFMYTIAKQGLESIWT